MLKLKMSLVALLAVAALVTVAQGEAESQPLITVQPSADSLEAHSRQYHDVNLWVGMEQVAALHEQQRLEFFRAVEAAEQERERQEAVAAAKAAKAAAAAKAAKVQTATAGKPAAASSYSGGDVWHDLAMCETGGKMDNPNTGNGYFGFFQFSLGTWESVGGTGYPHEHSYGTQKSFAQKLQARSGWGQWPHCAAKLGLLR